MTENDPISGGPAAEALCFAIEKSVEVVTDEHGGIYCKRCLFCRARIGCDGSTVNDAEIQHRPDCRVLRWRDQLNPFSNPCQA